ncbi:uncharacterized protein B0I36DRAFT_310650 [Microdochium trichocladiopsis]|uniref:Uncharacterized protein n=1 Tax=Microdochium trichocladiopsis TaxID=1682393 RepID=A0A9P8YJA1_9PEZI|nr:uncharacterized protein B0I36DRAFT_310650 [Microdochium trichocladiopsis]KAH7040426.1 hypothetical protein B0I36DRAFT_310650 [Microdochium trichocladiopsis]
MSEEVKIGEQRQEFVSTFEKLYNAIMPTGLQPGQNRNENTSKSKHILREEAEAIMLQSQGLLDKFEKASEMLKSFDLASPLETWNQDKHDLADIMMCGRDYGQHIVEGILVPGLYQDPHTHAHERTENQEIAAGLIVKGKTAVEGNNWGTVFEDQLRRSVALANTIFVEGTARDMASLS